MEIIKNRNYIEKMYILMGGAIFTHFVLVIILCILLLKNIFITGEYKKILKDKSLVIVEGVLGFSIVMSLCYHNYYGFVAIPILLCIMVGRYYTRIVNDEFKNYNLELIGKFSAIAFFISLTETLITGNRAGYFAYLNPNYLGSIMMMAAIVNLYLSLKKKSKINFFYIYIEFSDYFTVRFKIVPCSGNYRSICLALLFPRKKIFFHMHFSFRRVYCRGLL